MVYVSYAGPDLDTWRLLAAFSSGAVEAHPTIEYHKKVEEVTSHIWRPPGCGGPACPVLNPALVICE